MPPHSYLLDVVSGRRTGPAAASVRAGLAGLSYAYSAGLKLFLAPFGIGIRRQARLGCRVVSIGNLTVGGTGKTSITQAVCEMASARGLRVCILSRGYRGANEFGAAIVSTEKRVELDARAAGDEAYLLARTLPGVPVLVGKDRRKTGALAIERFKPNLIVLDDGMQYYWLHRDLDVVLLDARRPFDNGWAFPRGLLREPPSHLRRADAIVITNVDKATAGDIDALRRRIDRLAPGRPTYTAQYLPQELRPLDRSAALPVEWLCGRCVATLCALGSPEAFEDQVTNTGAALAHRSRMPDHHEPTLVELNAAIASAVGAGAEAVIVSEKDAVKLPPIMRPLPFYALVVRQRIDNENAFSAQVFEGLS